jgi:hypothetical protein
MHDDEPERSCPTLGSGTAAWHSEVEGLFDRMQTAAFARAALTILDKPLRVDLSDQLRHGSAGERGKEAMSHAS